MKHAKKSATITVHLRRRQAAWLARLLAFVVGPGARQWNRSTTYPAVKSDSVPVFADQAIMNRVDPDSMCNHESVVGELSHGRRGHSTRIGQKSTKIWIDSSGQPVRDRHMCSGSDNGLHDD